MHAADIVAIISLFLSVFKSLKCKKSWLCRIQIWTDKDTESSRIQNRNGKTMGCKPCSIKTANNTFLHSLTVQVIWHSPRRGKKNLSESRSSVWQCSYYLFNSIPCSLLCCSAHFLIVSFATYARIQTRWMHNCKRAPLCASLQSFGQINTLTFQTPAIV